MAENTSTPSETDPKHFMNADPEEALRMVVEIYNAGVEPECYLNWENVKEILDTTEKNPHDFSNEELEKRSKQRKKDKKFVEKRVKLAKGLKDHNMEELADFLVCELDNRGKIKCPDRKRFPGLQPDFPEDKGRAFPAYG